MLTLPGNAHMRIYTSTIACTHVCIHRKHVPLKQLLMHTSTNKNTCTYTHNAPAMGLVTLKLLRRLVALPASVESVIPTGLSRLCLNHWSIRSEWNTSGMSASLSRYSSNCLRESISEAYIVVNRLNFTPLNHGKKRKKKRRKKTKCVAL